MVCICCKAQECPLRSAGQLTPNVIIYGEVCMKIKKIALTTILIIFILFLSLSIIVFSITYHPPKLKKLAIVGADTDPILKAAQQVKVLSWNVQYMAGKEYVFWYDEPDNSGPDSAISRENIEKTFSEVVRVILDEAPDVIFLQEVHDGAKRTFYEDQLKRLLELLPNEYSCYTQAYYWKAKYVPLKQIMGSVGMKLVVISKYKIDNANRHQLAIMPKNILERQFQFKRAVLEVHLPVKGGKSLVLMNTHLNAFAQGDDTMQKQVAGVDAFLKSLTIKQYPYVIAGDFNLIPPGAYTLYNEKEKGDFNPDSEIKVLFEKYNAIPELEDTLGEEKENWFTSFPNRVAKLDRTIDYFFYSDNLVLIDKYIRQHDTLRISDHLPVVAIFQLP